jgi:hypothetical protein
MDCKPQVFQISIKFLLRDTRFVYSVYLLYSELLTTCWCTKSASSDRTPVGCVYCGLLLWPATVACYCDLLLWPATVACYCGLLL